jgi:hypothetical protein
MIPKIKDFRRKSRMSRAYVKLSRRVMIPEEKDSAPELQDFR